MMKFKRIIGRVKYTSYIAFEFEPHSAKLSTFGDQIWSDGEIVEIVEYVDSDLLELLFMEVTNLKAFKGALLRAGVEPDWEF